MTDDVDVSRINTCPLQILLPVCPTTATDVSKLSACWQLRGAGDEEVQDPMDPPFVLLPLGGEFVLGISSRIAPGGREEPAVLVAEGGILLRYVLGDLFSC